MKDVNEMIIQQSLIGLPVMLTCPQVIGSPTPQISWHKDQNEVVQTDNLKIMNSDRLLAIFESSSDDGGVYHCEAKNAAGQCRRSFNVSILGECRSMTAAAFEFHTEGLECFIDDNFY